MEELRAIVDPCERILYQGKPNKKCYIFESIFNPLLFLAVFWATIDFGIIGGVFSLAGSGMLSFIIPFMLLHMMPVWIYLGGVLFTARKYRNTAYIVTDRAIYVSGGIFTRNINTKPIAELSHINLHRGFFDQMFHVGDINARTNRFNQNGKAAVISIASISNYVEVYNLVKKLQTDIYSDVMSHNDSDSLLLPRILADFPDFDVSLAKTYARNYIRENLQDRQTLTIHRIVISQYLTSSTQRTIVFQAAVAFTENGKEMQKLYDLHYCHLLSGDGDTVAANCPNCGGALGYGVTVCPYCQSRIVNVLGNTWQFIDFIET